MTKASKRQGQGFEGFEGETKASKGEDEGGFEAFQGEDVEDFEGKNEGASKKFPALLSDF